MESKSQNKFTDEMLHFLYSSSIFQSFTEEEQVLFLQQYNENRALHEMLHVAIKLNEVIEEVECAMLPISEGVPNYFKRPIRSISKCLKIDENVYQYPFGEQVKEQGPFIVCLQQGNGMEDASLFCKGMLMPLFDLCNRQKRDLIILAFSEDVLELRYEYGESHFQKFNEFIALDKKGESKIIPALERIITILNEDKVINQTEVLLITNNELMDLEEENVLNLVQMIKEQSVSITAISTKKMHSEQAVPFLNKHIL